MIGLLIGGVMNFICIMIAVAGGSFQLERKEVAITTLVVMFIAVLIQSAYEELFYRGFLLRFIEEASGILKPGNFLFGPVATPINNLFYNSPFACGTWARESIASGWVFGVEDSIQAPIVQGIVAVAVFIMLKKKRVFEK